MRRNHRLSGRRIFQAVGSELGTCSRVFKHQEDPWARGEFSRPRGCREGCWSYTLRPAHVGPGWDFVFCECDVKSLEVFCFVLFFKENSQHPGTTTCEVPLPFKLPQPDCRNSWHSLLFMKDTTNLK